MSSKLLINENPLVFQPSLAVKIGLNEAIILQQIRYWLTIKEQTRTEMGFYDDKYWVWNSVEEWKKQFPFFSESTIKRTLKNLKDLDLIFVKKFNKHKWDHTNFYTINQKKVIELEENVSDNKTIDITDSVKLTESPVSGRPVQQNQNEPIFYTETTTETTTDIIDYSVKEKIYIETFDKFWTLYDKKIKRKKCYNVWCKIKIDLHDSIFDHIDKYIKSTSNKKFRSNPLTYLNNECWNDEIIDYNKKENGDHYVHPTL